MGENKKELARVALKKRAVSAREPFQASAEQLAALAAQFGVAVVELGGAAVPVALLEWIPKETAMSHAVVPLRSSGDTLEVAMADPSNQRQLEELSFVTGKQIVAYVAPREDILQFVELAYAAQRRGESMACGPAAGDGPEVISEAGNGFDEFAGFESLSLNEASGEGRLGGLPSAPKARPAPPRLDSLPVHASLRAAGPAAPPMEIEEVVPELEGCSLDAPELVLVVDDDAAIRALVVRLLESRGLRTLEAATGAEALQILFTGDQEPSLVVLDAMLPEVHGFEVLRQVRAHERLSRVAVIVLTAVHKGWRFAEDLRAMSGIQHYIEKPFAAAQLLGAVDELLRNKVQPGIGEQARRCLEDGIGAIGKGDFAAAERSLADGLQLEPQAYQLHFQVGVCHGKQGRAFEAIAAFEHAVGIQPRYFAGVKNLAVLYQRIGFQNKSTELWERALSLAPDQVTRDSIREHLRRLL